MPPVFEISTYIDVSFLESKIIIDIRFFYLYIRTNLFTEIKVILLSNNVFVNIEKIFKKCYMMFNFNTNQLDKEIDITYNEKDN